jgi:ATP dependent DNA ligase domain
MNLSYVLLTKSGITMLKYPSIENHFNITKSGKIMSQIDKLFYATEKIHGSNMQIKLDKQGFAYFSRNRQLTDTDPFYNKLVNAGNTKKILEIAESYLKSNSLDEMYIFGELYGAGIKNMQYQENLDNIQQFRVFDVFIREDNHMRTLSQSEFYNLFDESLRVPDMNITKTLGELIKDELGNESKLGGETEGLVYKPVESQELNLQDGSIVNYVAVKHKTEKFAEIKARPKVKAQMATEDVEFVNNISRYFTMSRLEGLLGKLAIEPDVRNLSKIIPAYLDDVKEDYLKTENPTYFNEKLLHKQSNLVVNLVKELLMNN